MLLKILAPQHLLGGKGKDLLSLLLGGEGRTGKGEQRRGGKLYWAPTKGRANTLFRLSYFILLGSLGGHGGGGGIFISILLTKKQAQS